MAGRSVGGGEKVIDFAMGFALGALVVAIVWKMLATQKTLVIRVKDAEATLVEEEITAIKPDNAKVKHYSSPEYRAEMAYVKEQNKSRRG